MLLSFPPYPEEGDVDGGVRWEAGQVEVVVLVDGEVAKVVEVGAEIKRVWEKKGIEWRNFSTIAAALRTKLNSKRSY